MPILQQVFLDNTIESYIGVAITILIALLLKRIISKYLTAIIFRLGKTQWRGMDKAQFDQIIINPLERIFLVIVIILSLDDLNFPKDLIFTIHKVTSRDIIDAIASAIIIITVVSLILRFMDFLVLVIKHKSAKPNSPSEHQLLFFFKDFIRVVIIIFGGLFILKISLRINIGGLLTGLSIVGAALALSARESLENLIASFVIFFDKPFETGDMVKVNNITGSVERIGLRSTRIRTPEKSLVTVPNKQMVDSILDNWSSRNLVRNEIKTVLSSHSTSEELQNAIDGIKEILSQQKIIETFTVYLQEINNDNALISSVYFTPLHLVLAEVNELKQDINLDIKKMQESKDIKPAITRNVTLVEGTPLSEK
jgi:MscS family membrane protein